MSGNKPTFYWDSNVYLAWLLQEEAHKAHLSHIDTILAANAKRENVILTSTITLLEVLSCKMSPEQESKFRGIFDQYSHLMVEVTGAISEKARTYREFFVAKNDGKNLLVPDAIHLATASIYQADQVHTFDDGRKPGVEDHLRVKSVSLLSLDGNVAGDAMRICRPFVAPPPPKPPAPPKPEQPPDLFRKDAPA